MSANLQSLLIPLEQLIKLHSAMHTELQFKFDELQKRKTWVLFTLVFILIVFGFMIAKKTLTAIGDVIAHNHVIEKSLRHSKKMDAVGQLTGGIAHDFNNILAIIIGNIEFLKLDIHVPEKAYKRVDAIEESAQRAAVLTKQLLKITRPLAVENTPVNINNIIKKMEDLIVRSVSPMVLVILKLNDDLWRTTISLPDFEDSLLNLIINARDAMHGKKGELHLETRNTRLDENAVIDNPDVDAGDYVELVIRDTGAGISGELLENIFEPFYTTKLLGRGTGLGLSMVFGFLKRARGHIKVESELGIGTCITIYLQRAKD